MGSALTKKATSFDDPLAGWSGGQYTAGVYSTKKSRTALTAVPDRVDIGADPNASAGGNVVRPGDFNAKTLPLGRPDLAAANYNVTTKNVADQFGRLWNARGESKGGSKVIFDKFSQWASAQAITERGGDPNGPQWRLIADAVRTGKVDPRIDPKLLVTGMGVGLSEAARSQQHKERFLDSAFGQILTIGAEIAATLATGNPMAGAAVGAGLGYVKDHNFMGVLKGGIQGYGVGKATAWVANGGLSALTQPVGGGINATGATIADKAANVAGNLVVAGKETLAQGLTVGNALTVLTTAGAARDLLVGAGTTALAAGGAGLLAPGSTDPAGGASAQPAKLTDEERFQTMVLRRRRAVSTDLAWGHNTAAALGRPSLLGGSVKLGA